MFAEKMRQNQKLPGLVGILLFALVAAADLIDSTNPKQVSNNQLELRRPQIDGNYYSGAIFVQVVNTDGGLVENPTAIQCPDVTTQQCQNVKLINWCCPAYNTCTQMQNGLVGCCPAGVDCTGPVNEAKTVTVTVPVTGPAPTLTPSPTFGAQIFQQSPGTTTTTTTTQGGGVFITQSSSTTQRTISGACSTLTMNGVDLPTLFPHYCTPGVAIVQGGTTKLEILSTKWAVLSLVASMVMTL